MEQLQIHILNFVENQLQLILFDIIHIVFAVEKLLPIISFVLTPYLSQNTPLLYFFSDMQVVSLHLGILSVCIIQ